MALSLPLNWVHSTNTTLLAQYSHEYKPTYYQQAFSRLTSLLPKSTMLKSGKGESGKAKLMGKASMMLRSTKVQRN